MKNLNILIIAMLYILFYSKNLLSEKGKKVMKSWKIENIIDASKSNPESFLIPSKNERENQKKGNQVRLNFILLNPKEGDPRAERMWVEILKEKSLLSKYKGILVNEPVYIKDLKIGDEIEFNSENIAQVIIKKGDPLWIDSSEKKALVSKMCLDKNAVIRFLYREKPDREEDSGWRIFTGLETDEYNNDSNNIVLIEVGYLLDKDPSLLEPLKGDYGSVFERIDKKFEWKKVEDWQPGI